MPGLDYYPDVSSKSSTQELTTAIIELRTQAKMIIANSNLFTAIDLQYNVKLSQLRNLRSQMGSEQYLKYVDELTDNLRVALDSWNLQDTAKMLEAKSKIEAFCF